MTRFSFIITLLLLVSAAQAQQSFDVKSPDGDLQLQVTHGDQISFQVKHKNKLTVKNATIALDLGSGKVLGKDARLKSNSINSKEETTSFVVSSKDKEVTAAYNELILKFKEKFSLEFRVYNDGVAYRFITALGKKNIQVYNEQLDLDFPEGSTSYFPKEKSMYSHFEQEFIYQAIDTIPAGDFCAMPVRFDAKDGAAVLLTEADLYDYPCLFLEKKTTGGFEASAAPVVLETRPLKGRSDRSEEFVKQADYIAETTGSRSFPWRVFVISDDDRDFVKSNLVMQLSRPNTLKSTDWIKPGRIAWDWYNANNIYGVDFESGINTQTYKYYIDFASEYGLEYVILDEGWTKTTTEVMESNPDIDIPELVSYAKSKNVNLILWLLWHPLDKNIEGILSLYHQWGVKGIKVDFMQRADQYMVNSYERIAKIAAENELMVDFHGAFKPAGLRRAYPNVMTYEGVLGNENNKWSELITPEHTVTLPFTRMVAGPMDFTPGAMANAQPLNYHVSFDRPMSIGTRCHQVAMYAVYESPLQMLCDAPSAYLEDKETTSFIAQFPAAWDETKVLEGKIGEYIAIARRSGDKWYIGAMTNSSARDMELDLSFLEDGNYTIELMKDGINAEKYAEDYKKEQKILSDNKKVTLHMAKGGGWAAIISKK